MNPTMVRGTIIVKATKVEIENSNDYYFEFSLNEMQTQQLLTQLTLDHVANNTWTIVHKHESDMDHLNFLKEVMDKNPEMDAELKKLYFQRILDLTEIKL